MKGPSEAGAQQVTASSGVDLEISYLRPMAKKVNSAGAKRSSTGFEGTVVYRGIKILPIRGRRSATAEAFRDALLRKESGPKPGHRRR